MQRAKNTLWHFSGEFFRPYATNSDRMAKPVASANEADKATKMPVSGSEIIGVFLDTDVPFGKSTCRESA